jgi:integrase
MRTPPPGVRLSLDYEPRPSGFRARVRWTDPETRRQVSRAEVVSDEAAVEDFFERMRVAVATGIDPGITVAGYLNLVGDRWLRGIDSSSTGDPYRAGMSRRVIPTFGHIPVRMVTAGLVDRVVDGWEGQHSTSTLKCTLAALTRLLDEAVRDGVIATNPARSRARRSWSRRGAGGIASPRSHAIPDLEALTRLVDAVARVHRTYADHVLLCALLAARGSEVAGLVCGDVDLEVGVVHIDRQVYPGAGGLVTKPTKGRRSRVVPILEPLRPTLSRLADGRERSVPLVRGPRGGVITTATLRRATNWDHLVHSLGLAGLRRHGLRHTGATWLADAGVPLHVLQEILGHQSLETTRGYLHADYRHLTAAASLGSAFLANQSPASPQPTGPRTTLRSVL